MLYELIQIRGNDAEEFLQGQLTQDVAALGTASSLPAAWCNAKGRIVTLVRLLALQDFDRPGGAGLSRRRHHAETHPVSTSGRRQH